MARAQVFEGTWEEVKKHESTLAGRYVRVILDPQQKPAQELEPAPVAKKRPLSGMGKFRGKTGGTAALEQSKQEDILLEERRF